MNNQSSVLLQNSKQSTNYGQIDHTKNLSFLSRYDFFKKVDKLLSYGVSSSVFLTRIVQQPEMLSTYGYLTMELVIDDILTWMSKCAKNTFKGKHVDIVRLDKGVFAVLVAGHVDERKTHEFSKLLSAGTICCSNSSKSESIIVNFSLGFCKYPDKNISNLDELLQRAEGALAKHEIVSCCNAIAGGKFAFGYDELFDAISKDQLELWYQPQVNLVSSEIVGFEGLVRWRHPLYGIIYPLDFLRWFDSCGLTCDLNEWVANTGFKKCRDFIDEGKNLKLALNFDAGMLEDGRTLEAINCAKERYNVPPQLIELEITETMSIQKGDARHLALQKLRSLGYQIAIDDFGAGTSNIEYLTYLEVDVIKLDRVFCNNFHDDNMLRIARSIIDFAKAKHCNISVLAEGIESETQLALVTSIGCDLAQGYYLGRPNRVAVNVTPVIQAVEIKESLSLVTPNVDCSEPELVEFTDMQAS